MEQLLAQFRDIEGITVKPLGMITGYYIIRLNGQTIMSFRQYNNQYHVYPYASYFKDAQEQLMDEQDLIKLVKNAL